MPASQISAPARPGGRWGAVALFLALFSTALALGGALAHLYELPNKIGLPEADYFIVQKAYRGWALLVCVLAVELFSMLACLWLFRRDKGLFLFVLIALAGLLSAQTLFWIYTFPANAATENWTVVPEDWAALRRQWEYSHAAGAVLQATAMIALILTALKR